MIVSIYSWHHELIIYHYDKHIIDNHIEPQKEWLWSLYYRQLLHQSAAAEDIWAGSSECWLHAYLADEGKKYSLCIHWIL